MDNESWNLLKGKPQSLEIEFEEFYSEKAAKVFQHVTSLIDISNTEIIF